MEKTPLPPETFANKPTDEKPRTEVSLEDFLQAAQEAELSAKAEVSRVEINGVTYEGEVTHWMVDLAEPGEAHNQEPAVIYIKGYGQQSMGEEGLNNEERETLTQAYNAGIRRVIFASPSTIPRATDGEFNAPGTQISAEITKAIVDRELGIVPEEELPPMRLIGYSLGAGTISSYAAAVSRMEKARRDDYDEQLIDQREKHTLTMLSASGITQYTDNPEKAREGVRAFSKEVLRMANDQISGIFKKAEKSIEKEKDPRKFAEKITDAWSNVDALWRIIERAATSFHESYSVSAAAFRNDITTLLSKNPDNEKIGQEFNVYVNLPYDDSIFPLDYAEKHQEETADIRHKVLHWETMTEELLELAFPNAYEVKVKLVKEGNPKHIDPSDYPEKYLTEKSFTDHRRIQ